MAVQALDRPTRVGDDPPCNAPPVADKKRVVGILLALPLLLVAYLVWAIGSVIGFLAIAERLVSHEEGWLKPLLIAAGLNGLLVVTGIGSLIAFAIGAAGFGAILRS